MKNGALRIVAYNFLAGGSPSRDAWSALHRLAPDVLLAQECRAGAGASRFSTTLWAQAPARRWGTGIFASRGRVRPIAVPAFEGWVVGAELDRSSWLSARPLRVFSVHCPPGERGYIRTMHAILDALAPLGRDADLVLGGDFNVAAGLRRATDTVRFHPAERRLLERIASELELVPCWQAMHPRRPLAQTLRWSGNRSTPYHCDGIFAPRALRPLLRRCDVVAGPSWDRLSDHNPVLAVFERGAALTTTPPRARRPPS